MLAIIGFAASAGAAPPDLLREAGLDPSVLVDMDSHLPHAQEKRLWEAAVRLTGDSDFGLHLAEWTVRSPPENFDVLAFAARSCLTLGEQFRLAGRYIRLIHEGVQLTLEEEGQVVRLLHSHALETIIPRHPAEAMFGLLVLHGRLAVGDDLAPKEVCFAHRAPESTAEQARVFRAPVRYGCPRSELVFDRAALDRPQRHAEQRLLAVLDRQLGALLSGLPESRNFRDIVARCMVGELPDREPAVATIADKLNMSARSLQRRLQSEGTSFGEVLSDVRRDRALSYLKDPRVSIGEVAFLLGFLDVSAFHRAFRRWTGNTPAEYRRGAGNAPRAADAAAQKASRANLSGRDPGAP